MAQAPERKLDKEIESLIQVFADPKATSIDNIQEAIKASNALVAIGKPAVPKLIEGILGNNDLVAAECANVLQRIGSKALDHVRARWQGLDEVNRWKLMRFRGKFDYKASLDFVFASLDSKKEAVRQQAHEYLLQHQEPRAKAKLLEALNNEAPRLRWHLVGCSVPQNDKDFIKAHIRLLEPNSWIALGQGRPPQDGGTPPWWPDGRDRVVEALGRMKAKESAPTLLKVLQETGEGRAYLGFQILPLLEEFGYKESLPELKRIVATDKTRLEKSLVPPERIQALAARAMWQLGDRGGRSLFLQVLRDPQLIGDQGGNRLFACETIARFGDKAEIAALADYLDDPEGGIRAAACQGLERITGVVNRAPGWAESTEHDAPLWKQWYEKHREELKSSKK
jgi:HEAT repeat protein